jgi:predicted ATPase
MLAPTLRAYAEGLARLGEVEEAEKTIADLIERAESASPTYLLPELLRTRGDIIIARAPRDEQAAEACYRRAIAQAQSDGALSWELRAVISLARLLQQGSRLGEAVELLEHALSRFTEGFETGDLVEARELLQFISGSRFDRRLERKQEERQGWARKKSVPRTSCGRGGD